MRSQHPNRKTLRPLAAAVHREEARPWRGTPGSSDGLGYVGRWCRARLRAAGLVVCVPVAAGRGCAHS
ncbi:MAG: hypothetical protein F4184_09920 [Gemmatimonadetes bacterium]|nr:hypothetical protein [Gemmatimonadota bacterium]